MTLPTDDQMLRWAAADYDGTAQQRPTAVLRPADTTEISAAMRPHREVGWSSTRA